MGTPKRNGKLSTNGRNGTHRVRRRSAAASRKAEPRTLEDAILAAAASGKLAGAARSAIRVQREAGIPVTYQSGNRIVREHPDGRREVLGTVEPVEYELPKGVGSIRNG